MLRHVPFPAKADACKKVLSSSLLSRYSATLTRKTPGLKLKRKRRTPYSEIANFVEDVHHRINDNGRLSVGRIRSLPKRRATVPSESWPTGARPGVLGD